MPKTYDHFRYVRRNDSPWGLGIPANATLVYETPYGREYAWNDAPDPAPEPDFFADYIRAAAEKRRRTIEQFLIFTFDITEEERAFVEEVLAGKNITTITTSARGHGKTRRAWAWERLMKRLHTDPLPAHFWENVYGYQMLEDTLGRDIIHTLTKDRA